MTIDHDRHTTLQHALQRRREKCHPPLIDHLFVNARFAPAKRGGARLFHRQIRRNRRRTVESLQPERMTSVVDDGNHDAPFVARGFGFGSLRNLPDIVRSQRLLRVHGSSGTWAT